MTPSIGRIVHYVLSTQDARQINDRRETAFVQQQGIETGHIKHMGNGAEAGQVFPAMVVATFGGPNVNLQVVLDGTDTYWATSRPQHEGDTGSTHSVNTPDISYHGGSWHWPPRV